MDGTIIVYQGDKWIDTNYNIVCDNYEIVMNFRDEGMSMQEKALRAVKEDIHKESA